MRNRLVAYSVVGFSGAILCVAASYRTSPRTGGAAVPGTLGAASAYAYGRMLRVGVSGPPPPPTAPPGLVVNLTIDSPTPVPLPRFVAENTTVPFSDRA